MNEFLLPLPSILAKLKTLDANAPQWVMERAKILQREAHERALAAQRAEQSFFSLKNIFRIFANAFKPPPPMVLPSVESIARAQVRDMQAGWICTGNYMRGAIIEYMARANIDAHTFLDARERQSLAMLPKPEYGPYKLT